MNRPRSRGVSRWPLRPEPGPVEALSSWLRRLADLYNLQVKDLLGDENLGLPELEVLVDFDRDPPAALLSALAERTGVELARLRAMTLVGWQPWLFDTLYLDPWDAQEVFDTYVRYNCVLLAPGEAGTHHVSRWERWGGPWLNWQVHRACPVCATDPTRGKSLAWRLPLMASCVDHGCRLEHPTEVEMSLALPERRLHPTPVGEPLATLDRYTHQALAAGRVSLPGRSVHAGVWFRLLRSLLDEVSLALTNRHAHARATLEQVWQATGLPERAGLNVWQPYERLDWPTQQAMLLAAATALDLVANGRITARGRLASAIAPPRDHHVYAGDSPWRPRGVWRVEAMEQIETAVTSAMTDLAAARQLLAWFTARCRTPPSFEEKRAYLVGIPAAFLPSAGELDRTDLL